MARLTRGDRLLPANTRAIQKAVKEASARIAEYRIGGARGLVLHVLPSGTATSQAARPRSAAIMPASPA